MANEVFHNWETGATLYSTRFQTDGNVFITSGASDEVWGAGGNDADDYDVTMTEDGVGGHYVGDFDTSANIGEGVYRVTVFLQAGISPADTDIPIAQGVMYWDGTAEENVATIGDQLDGLTGSAYRNTNVYGRGE